MDWMEVFRLAMRALARNKMRSALTMLGVIIGVGAVIASVAVGEGAANEIQQQITNLGENMIWIEAGGRQVNGVRTGTYGTKSLTMEDAKAIAAQVSLVTNISPHVDTHVQVIYGSGNWNTTVRGVTPEYLSVRKWDIARGASFFTSDVESAANVCLLGQTVVDYVFGE